MNEQNSINVDIRPHEKGQLKAFADVTISTGVGEMTILSFRIIQKDGNPPWVAYPAINYTNKAGEPKEQQVILLVPSNRRKLTQAILAKFQES